jgi:hypothetical protein
MVAVYGPGDDRIAAITAVGTDEWPEWRDSNPRPLVPQPCGDRLSDGFFSLPDNVDEAAFARLMAEFSH